MVYSTRRFVLCLTLCHFVLVLLFFFFLFFFFFFFFFLSPFSIAITSLVEERAKLSAFRTFVRFLPVWICRFPLPLSVWEELRFVIVTLLGLFFYFFFQFDQAPGLPNCTISQKHLTTVDFFFFFFFFFLHIYNSYNKQTLK